MANTATVIKLPAHTSQRTYGQPLFGLPDGSVFAVSADPMPSGTLHDAPWAELAAHLNTRADPKAVRIAHVLHLSAHPDATMLFGSRAQGDHRHDSDLNIVLVSPRPTRHDFNASQIASQIYAHIMTVEIVHINTKQFAKDETYRNTLATEALLHGISISPTPSSWRSRYAPPNPAKNTYSWKKYQNLAYESKFAMDTALTAFTGRMHGTDMATSYFLQTSTMDEDQETRAAINSKVIRKNLPAAILKGMQAAIAATGSLPNLTGAVERLHNTLLQIAPDEDWQLFIPRRELRSIAAGSPPRHRTAASHRVSTQRLCEAPPHGCQTLPAYQERHHRAMSANRSQLITNSTPRLLNSRRTPRKPPSSPAQLMIRHIVTTPHTLSIQRGIQASCTTRKEAQRSQQPPQNCMRYTPMPESQTVAIMASIFPKPTQQLLDAIAYTKTTIAERNYRLHTSSAYHRELCIDPILDALGFDERYRVNFARSSSRVKLLVKHAADNLLLCAPPGELPSNSVAIANRHRVRYNIPGRWIVTNGALWRIHHPDPEEPTFEFTIEQPSAFWDLLMLGQSNQVEPE